MTAVKGYFDGINVKLLEDIDVKINQKLIITVMDEFIEPTMLEKKESARGLLSKYADEELAKKEKEAWERAAVEKYGNI
jgi:hypothetical protein